MPTPTSSHMTGPPFSKPSERLPSSQPIARGTRFCITLVHSEACGGRLRRHILGAQLLSPSCFPSHPRNNIEQVGKDGLQGLGKSKSDPNPPASCLSRRFLGFHSLTGPMLAVWASWISGTTILAWGEKDVPQKVLGIPCNPTAAAYLIWKYLFGSI